jgi:hypothetical protein
MAVFSLNDEQIESMLDEGKTDVFNECILSQVWRRLREQQNPGTIQIENFVTLFLEKN